MIFLVGAAIALGASYYWYLHTAVPAVVEPDTAIEPDSTGLVPLITFTRTVSANTAQVWSAITEPVARVAWLTTDDFDVTVASAQTKQGEHVECLLLQKMVRKHVVTISSSSLLSHKPLSIHSGPPLIRTNQDLQFLRLFGTPLLNMVMVL